VSLANQNNTSVSSLLPLLKFNANDNNAKLTRRQLRIAEIIKGEKGDWSTSLNSLGANMLHESSSLTLRAGGVGAKDGIRSTKAFLTSVTPSKGSISFADQATPNARKEPRKVFGATAYLER
jgi:hypothetical protein